MKPNYNIENDMLIKLAEISSIDFNFEENAIDNLEKAQQFLTNAGYDYESLVISGIIAKYATLEDK